MDLPKIQLGNSGGMLDGLKAKLGFPADQGYDGYDNYDDYDDYDDGYGDYDQGYDDYDDGYDADAAARYEPPHSVSTRSSSYARPRHASGSVSAPRLVSIDDVRARTQVPESLHRDPLPPRHVTSASRLGSFRGQRTVIDGKVPSAAEAEAEAQAVSALATANRERSESLDSLFTPTTDAVAPTTRPASAASTTTRSFDPYEAYSGAGLSRHNPTRSLMVVKPMSYGEAERVAKGLKVGDVVVLALRNTPEPLVKRLLDFSFGVASALDASVDCIADKVFVLTRGAAITDDEKTQLRNQGVI